MWAVEKNNFSMVEGDWGIELPVTFKGISFTLNDVLKFTFKKNVDGEEILSKEYTPVDSTVNLVLTEAESALFPKGNYVYKIDWSQEGAFLCNLIASADFKVVNKA